MRSKSHAVEGKNVGKLTGNACEAWAAMGDKID